MLAKDSFDATNASLSILPACRCGSELNRTAIADPRNSEPGCRVFYLLWRVKRPRLIAALPPRNHTPKAATRFAESATISGNSYDGGKGGGS